MKYQNKSFSVGSTKQYSDNWAKVFAEPANEPATTAPKSEPPPLFCTPAGALPENIACDARALGDYFSVGGSDF